MAGSAPGGGGEGVHEVVLDGRVHRGVIVKDVLEGLVDFRPARVLGEVSAGAGPQRVDHGPGRPPPW